MNKLWGFFKKHDGLIAILVFAIVAIYAVCMSTPAAVCRRPFVIDGEEPYRDFYSNFMLINDVIIYLAIFGIVWGVLYKVLRNEIRKVYYISNIVWHCVYIAFCIFACVYIFIGVSQYQAAYMSLPFDEMNAYYESHNATWRINPNTPVFILGYIVAIVVALSALPPALVLFKQMRARFGHKNEVVEEVTELEPSEKEASEKGE